MYPAARKSGQNAFPQYIRRVVLATTTIRLTVAHGVQSVANNGGCEGLLAHSTRRSSCRGPPTLRTMGGVKAYQRIALPVFPNPSGFRIASLVTQVVVDYVHSSSRTARRSATVHLLVQPTLPGLFLVYLSSARIWHQKSCLPRKRAPFGVCRLLAMPNIHQTLGDSQAE